MNLVDLDFLNIDEPDWSLRVIPYCLKVLEALEVREKEISLVFTDDATISGYNLEYRNKTGATDVLSFCQDEGEEFPDFAESSQYHHLGDIIVSLETVEKHRQKFEVTFDEELRRVLVHGILHLLGRTHATRAPEEPMLIEQERILHTIGEQVL